MCKRFCSIFLALCWFVSLCQIAISQHALHWKLNSGDPESKEDVEADTSGDETDPVDPGHKARDEMFCAVASVRVGY